LRAAHRRARDKRKANRIMAVALMASGWPAEDVAAWVEAEFGVFDTASGMTAPPRLSLQRAQARP